MILSKNQSTREEALYNCPYCNIGVHQDLKSVEKCKQLRDAIIKHNTDRRNKGKSITKDSNSIWIFHSSIFNSEINGRNTAGFMDRKYDKIYVPLKRYEDSTESINELIHVINHEMMHYILYHEHPDDLLVTIAYDSSMMKIIMSEYSNRKYTKAELINNHHKWIRKLKLLGLLDSVINARKTGMYGSG